MLLCSCIKSTLVQKPEKRHLLMLLHPVRHQWREIGEMLGIEYSDIKSEEKNLQHDDTVKVSEVLQLWINQKGREKVSWKTIITVIRNPPLKNMDVAKEICSFILTNYNSGQQGIHSQ